MIFPACLSDMNVWIVIKESISHLLETYIIFYSNTYITCHLFYIAIMAIAK